MDSPLPTPPDASALYQRAACGLACTSDDGTFLTVNETLCQWLGKSAEELVGKTKLQGLLTMGARIFHQTHWAPLLRMQGSVSEVKLEVIHGDGHAIPMVMNARRREVQGGVVHEIAMIVAHDRDAYEKELVASREKLQSLVEETTKLHEEAKDRALFAEQMVGIVSHDLRNPLSSILMGTALLARSSANQEAVLGRINRAADRATRMIADLLDFTQARLGKGIALSRGAMDLRRCVSEAVEELSLAYPGRSIVHTHTGESNCTADGDRLAQLVGNLVSNAVAYGRQDTPVTVFSECSGGATRIAVRNAGDPIPANLQATLFQPMVRGEVDASRRSVGLGLFIVNEIVKSHGGSVSVTSTAEDGTTFVAVLPSVPPA
ncbi:MAG: PAS domain-containing sensor histidine kinase [Ramlibacter sp.]